MELLITFLIIIVPLAIAGTTGRAGLAILATTLIFIFLFTILNMGGRRFVEVLEFALGLSMYVALFSTLGAHIGARLYSESDKQKGNPENQKATSDDL